MYMYSTYPVNILQKEGNREQIARSPDRSDVIPFRTLVYGYLSHHIY